MLLNINFIEICHAFCASFLPRVEFILDLLSISISVSFFLKSILELEYVLNTTNPG